jgi:hypothetical protein
VSAIKVITANCETANKNSVEKEIKWLKPNRGNLKLNIDATYYPNGAGAVAGVLRDSKGEVQGDSTGLLITYLARRRQRQRSYLMAWFSLNESDARLAKLKLML